MELTTNAIADVDKTFMLIFGVSAAILVLITATMIYFVFRYSKKRNPVPTDIDGNVTAEIIWTVVPTLLVLGMFYYGWTSYQGLRTVPEDAMPVGVTARMWSWTFTYENGRKSDTLVAPVGKPVKLNINSRDVIHGLYIPAFRIKVDAVPGMATHAWFAAQKEGEHDLFCSVYCGLKHADMLAKVRIVSDEEFQKWLAESPSGKAHPGKALMEQFGCAACHSFDGTPSLGPTFKGLAGRTVTLVSSKGGERTVTADAAYLKEAIVGDKKLIVKGYDPVMPSFAGQIPDAQVDQMVDYLLNGDKPAPDGAALAVSEGCTACHSTDGSKLMGPSFKGLMGSVTTVVDKGADREVLVNRAYLYDVLANPAKRPTKGYDPVMPAYPQLTEQERLALAEYLESLGAPTPPDGHGQDHGKGHGQ